MTPEPAAPASPASPNLPQGLLLCALSIPLELLAFALLLSGRLPGAGVAVVLVLHTGACGLSAYGLHGMMPPSQQVPRRAGLLFLFAVTFFLPVFGVLGLLGGLLAAIYYPNQPPPPSPWQSIELPELPPQPSTVADHAEFGDGALSAMLRYCPNPERRLAAVLAVRHLRDRNDVEVVRLALTDTVDDVRLLAYSVLDRKEQGLNARLKSLIGQLEASAKDEHKRARLEKRLALTHFEIIELGLAQGEVQSYLLKAARRHVEAALRAAPSDCESLFLLGAIALRQDELPVAEKAFLGAQVLGMSVEKVLPYLAELAFRQRRFSMVTHYLRAIDPVYFHAQPLLGDIAAHWLPEEGRCPPK